MMPMIATTIKSSISVKPLLFLIFVSSPRIRAHAGLVASPSSPASSIPQA
jgi:hypothetical protein